MNPIQTGSLVIADIGGYTRYLTQVELDHSTDVLADVTGVVVDELTATLVLSKLEGDAVFAYDLRAEPDPAALVQTIEACYVAFRRRLRTIQQRTSCQCNACLRIPDVDLKFVAHHGRFVLHTMAGSEELVGGDVILVHRLLKNTVHERRGLSAYALLTGACFAGASLDPSSVGFVAHSERYDDVGEVDGFVLDLGSRWQAYKERTAIVVEPGPDVIEVVWEVDAPPSLVWQYTTSPETRPLWQEGTLRVDQSNPRGVPGIGTRNHCVHGGFAVDEEVLDWKPPHYFTERSTVGDLQMVGTFRFEPLEGGSRTRVTYRTTGETPEATAGLRAMWPMISTSMEASSVRLNDLLTRALGKDGSSPQPEEATTA
jgi:uncharacterized protein YndB with AHSA1/START domain